MRRCEQEMGPSRVCRIGREDPCGQGEAPEAGHQQNLICLRPDARHGRAYALPPIFWEGCISPRVYPAHSLRGAPAPPHAPDAPVESSRAVCIPCERCGGCARAKKMQRVEQASHPSISADLHFPRRDRRGQAARGLAHRISHDPVPRSCLAPAPAGRDRLSVTFSALPSAFAATPRLASALCCSEPRPAGTRLLHSGPPRTPRSVRRLRGMGCGGRGGQLDYCFSRCLGVDKARTRVVGSCWHRPGRGPQGSVRESDATSGGAFTYDVGYGGTKSL